MAELVVHHLDNSRSQRIIWLLEELDLPYTIRQYHRNPTTMRAPRELADVHPLGKAPILTIDDEVHAESGAIVEGVLDRFGEGRLRPQSPGIELNQFRFFMHYAEGSLMSPLLVRLITDRLASPSVPFFLRPLTKAVGGKIDASFTKGELAKHSKFLEATLASRPWFAGEAFTAADIQMSFPIEAAAARAGFGAFPAIAEWLTRIHDRPAYKRAIERGGALNLGG